MRTYQIRILTGDDASPTVFQQTYFSDFAAIRSGSQIANGGAFEVWRGMDCIYSIGSETLALRPNPKNHLAKLV